MPHTLAFGPPRAGSTRCPPRPALTGHETVPEVPSRLGRGWRRAVRGNRGPPNFRNALCYVNRCPEKISMPKHTSWNVTNTLAPRVSALSGKSRRRRFQRARKS